MADDDELRKTLDQWADEVAAETERLGLPDPGETIVFLVRQGLDRSARERESKPERDARLRAAGKRYREAMAELAEQGEPMVPPPPLGGEVDGAWKRHVFACMDRILSEDPDAFAEYMAAR